MNYISIIPPKTNRMADRVALAKDVLIKISAGTIRPRHSGYLNLSLDKVGCSACALGSMMAACCKPEKSLGSDPTEVIACLTPLFDVGELALIEAAFEGDPAMPVAGRAGRAVTPAQLQRAAKAFGIFDDPEDDYDNTPAIRVTRIMKNIIENNGAFVLSDLRP